MAVVVLFVWLPINAFLADERRLLLPRPGDLVGYLGVRLTERLVGMIGTGAVIALGVGCWELGRPIGLGGAFIASLSQWRRLVLGGIVGTIAVGLGLVLPGLFAALCVGWLYPIYVVEQCRVGEGFRRSVEITQRHFWFSLLLMATTTAAALVLGLAEGIAAGVLDLFELERPVLWVLNTVLGLPTEFGVACTWLIITAALMRIREEEGAEPSVVGQAAE